MKKKAKKTRKIHRKGDKLFIRPKVRVEFVSSSVGMRIKKRPGLDSQFEVE